MEHRGRAVDEAVAELTLTDDGSAKDAQKGDAAEAQAETDPSAEAQTDAGSPDGSAVVRTTVDGTELIGYEEAVRIAAEDSGATELAKIKFEYDGRFYDYEVELREGRAEYEYKIDAQTGEIVEAERD